MQGVASDRPLPRGLCPLCRCGKHLDRKLCHPCQEAVYRLWNKTTAELAESLREADLQCRRIEAALRG